MFTFPFCYTPHPLVEMAAGCLRSYLDKRADLADELQSGKMMGVLVVENSAGGVGLHVAVVLYVEKSVAGHPTALLRDVYWYDVVFVAVHCVHCL